MFDVHITPFYPTTTLETGTTDAHTLKVVVLQKSGQEARRRSHSRQRQSWDSNQRDHKHFPMTSSWPIKFPTQQPTRGACRCCHVPALQQERKESGEPLTASLLVVHLWAPAQGLAPGGVQDKDQEELQLEHPSEFPRIPMGTLKGRQLVYFRS